MNVIRISSQGTNPSALLPPTRQLSIIFITRVEWGPVSERGLLFNPFFVIAASFSLTMFATTARLLLLVVLQEKRFPSPFSPLPPFPPSSLIIRVDLACSHLRP